MLKKIITALGLAFIIVACDPIDEYRNKSDTCLYNAAMELLEYGRYERAAKVFEEIDLQHPSSPFAPKGLLMSGYCYYLESNPNSRNTNRFPEAIDKFESFIRLHPNHNLMPYAIYMMGICYYEMLGDEMRDQTSGLKAASLFGNLIDRFPHSPYTQDATTKLKTITNYAAKKHVYVAQILINEGRYAPAIDRLHHAIKSGLDAEYQHKARELLNTCYKALKLNHLIITPNDLPSHTQL